MIAGTNKLEDVDIYAFDPPVPADAGTLNHVAVNSTDEVLKSLLRADIAQDRWIAGWENHKENLPEDPTQASRTTCPVPCSLLCCCHRASPSAVVMLLQNRKIGMVWLSLHHTVLYFTQARFAACSSRVSHFNGNVAKQSR